MTLLSTALAFIGLWGCNDKVDLEVVRNPYTDSFYGDTLRTRNDNALIEHSRGNLLIDRYGISVGTTTKVYRKPDLNGIPSKTPDLVKLKDRSNKEPFRMIVVGGSLSAGYRDGGYFNEGIESAYPNLIARQMGVEFNQPYFSPADYNGIGRKVLAEQNPTGGPIPKVNSATNNLGIVLAEGGKVRLKKYVGKIDNFSMPGHSISFLNSSNISEDMDNLVHGDYNSLQRESGWVKTRYAIAPYALRFKQNFKSLEESIKSKKYDLVLLELGFDDWLNSQTSIGSSGGISGLGTNYLDVAIQKVKQTEDTKICLATIPPLWLMPKYTIVDLEMIKKAAYNQPLFIDNANEAVQLTGFNIFEINSQLDSLLSPNINIALKPGITKTNPLRTQFWRVLDEGQRTVSNSLNKEIEEKAKKNGYALADIRSIYLQILSGKYVEDGIRIDPSWPEGNFFSIDGVFPTPLGQAVIANEFIRAINRTYKTEIPIIRISKISQ